jgi:hypothetical protein
LIYFFCNVQKSSTKKQTKKPSNYRPLPTPIPPTPLPAHEQAELDDIERRIAEQRKLVRFV